MLATCEEGVRLLDGETYSVHPSTSISKQVTMAATRSACDLLAAVYPVFNLNPEARATLPEISLAPYNLTAEVG